MYGYDAMHVFISRRLPAACHVFRNCSNIFYLHRWYCIDYTPNLDHFEMLNHNNICILTTTHRWRDRDKEGQHQLVNWINSVSCFVVFISTFNSFRLLLCRIYFVMHLLTPTLKFGCHRQIFKNVLAETVKRLKIHNNNNKINIQNKRHQISQRL